MRYAWCVNENVIPMGSLEMGRSQEDRLFGLCRTKVLALCG
jgi:hypothetical protein